MGRPRRNFLARAGRWIVALVLIPYCIGVTWTVVDLLAQVGRISQFWIPALAGAGAWFVVYFNLPKPLWIYVVGHELTHALWAVLCGGKVKAFKATSKGGHVVVTKTNLLITLSPYFFPLYAVLWILIFGLGNWCFGWRSWLPWFHFGLGMAYAFHITLTTFILRQRQPDLESEGWFLSAVVIWLGNALTLLIALPLLTKVVPLSTAGIWSFEQTTQLLKVTVKFLQSFLISR